jgi:hypothetical protein
MAVTRHCSQRRRAFKIPIRCCDPARELGADDLRLGSTPVNFASVPHGQSEDYESSVLNVADDTVIADAVTP